MKESNCDLLIIGAGPSGLMAATWASRFGIITRIIDKRGSKVFNGQADGLQCRSLEIFDSFGFADRVWKESNHMLEICFWNPDENGVIRRTDRLPDTIPGISRFQEVVLHQGRIERFFLDNIKKHSQIRVERGVLPTDLTIDHSSMEDNDAYPIAIQLQHLSEDEATPAQNSSNIPDGLFRSNLANDDTDELVNRNRDHGETSETVRAKYVIGCDGAHSWTRRKLGFNMEGEQTDHIWGVLDVIPITDFPDIRMRSAIHSTDSGSVMVIPRENKLVRFYIQLTEVDSEEGKQFDRSKINPEMILKAAQKIMKPYTLSYHYIDWWTAYQIGQRVSDKFSVDNRIFIVGDAVHTHSPKAGQGMNVSMQDSFNLVWKIGLVLTGVAQRSILPTYETERRTVAQDLIAFDHKFSRLFSGRPARDAADEVGISMDEFKSVFKQGAMFAAGLSVSYSPSILVVSTQAESKLAKNLQLGSRFPSAQVLIHASAQPYPFAHFLPSDGRFRVVLIAGSLHSSARLEKVGRLCEALKDILSSYTPADKKLDSVCQVLTVHSGPRVGLEYMDFPQLLRPFDDKTGWDYESILVDDESYHAGHGQAYEAWGVDKDEGCMAILRPDQHIAWIGGMDEDGMKGVDSYFKGFMIPA